MHTENREPAPAGDPRPDGAHHAGEHGVSSRRAAAARPTASRAEGDGRDAGAPPSESPLPDVDASEARYQGLVQSLPAAVYACDAGGRVTLYNEAAAELWGRRPIVGQDLWCGSHRTFRPDGTPLPHEECPMAVTLREGRAVHGAELVIERPDGSRRNVLAHPVPMHDQHGTPVGAINMLVDITDRKQAELELRATRDDLALQVSALTRLHDLSARLAGSDNVGESLTAILESLVELHAASFGLLSLIDPASGVLLHGASVGFSADALEAIGHVAPASGAGNCRAAFAAGERRVVEDVATDPCFEPFRAVANLVGFRAIHSTPIRTRTGELLGVLSVYFRETRQPTRREVQVADMCARQAADVIEAARTQQALREADRRKDEFLATLAHELRNPLAPIRNALQIIHLAKDSPLLVEQSRALMERQLKQMVRLIDDLLDLSRISGGKAELRRERVDLAGIIRSAVETSQSAIDQRAHALHVAMPNEAIYLDADTTRLSQVFANLLNNAARYTHRGGRIDLLVRRHHQGVIVTVRDTGIGIPVPMLPRVFEMFTQVRPDDDDARGGLGIGLNIVKRLVEMHGGTVEARSEGHGMGSEFIVRLPTLDAAAPEQPQRVTSSAEQPATRARRVLVADDNVDAASSLAVLLKVMGHDVRSAHNGAEAVEVAAIFRPQFILLDIGMPQLNGYEACRRLRQQSWAADVVIVALTGWGQEADKRQSADAGFDYHLVKPAEPAALEQLLASAPSRIA